VTAYISNRWIYTQLFNLLHDAWAYISDRLWAQVLIKFYQKSNFK